MSLKESIMLFEVFFDAFWNVWVGHIWEMFFHHHSRQVLEGHHLGVAGFPTEAFSSMIGHGFNGLKDCLIKIGKMVNLPSEHEGVASAGVFMYIAYKEPSIVMIISRFYKERIAFILDVF